jgi:hypothetical protein
LANRLDVAPGLRTRSRGNGLRLGRTRQEPMIILSDGKVNMFNLAKNAGTSVNQIERFYARNLPLSPELAKNLQSFGE